MSSLLKCFVSVGTGNPGDKAFEDTMIKFLGETAVHISTETEAAAKKFNARWSKHFDEKRFFRFNVEQGLQNIGLDEFKNKWAIEAATDAYLAHPAQKFRLQDCVQNLVLKRGVYIEYFLRIGHLANLP